VTERAERRGALRSAMGDVGVMLLPAVLAVTAAVVAAVAGEWYALPALAPVALGAGGLGGLAWRWSGPPRAATIPQSLATVAAGWLAVALVAAVPFLLSARLGQGAGADVGSAAVFTDPWSALFEGMSGFTSTGLTMVEQESRLPRSLQWWRSVLEWAGAVGVVVVVLALTGGQAGRLLYEAEGRSRLLRSDAHASSRRIWRIYAGLTLAGVLAFLAAGADPWFAVNHGLTGISTGGMVVTDDSFTGASPPVRAVGIAVMLAGMFVGGSEGSTTGRRKLRRVAWLGKASGCSPQRVAGPDAATEYRRPWVVDGRELDHNHGVHAVVGPPAPPLRSGRQHRLTSDVADGPPRPSVTSPVAQPPRKRTPPGAPRAPGRA
jgi:Trk-type K+ transport system membrane component